jgi:histidyl-tRNA synthetase
MSRGAASNPETRPAAGERPIGRVRGTADFLVQDYAAQRRIEHALLGTFEAAGYQPIRTPVLEFAELHERKSGAGIVARLDDLADARQGRVCLRPELTAGVVRAYVEAPVCPPLPWKVAMSGLVFRHQELGPGRHREFTQVGLERLGDGGPAADAEVIGLAVQALAAAGLREPRVRIGHVGLILEMLARSGLPDAVRLALVEVISEAAAVGHDVRAVEAAIERLSEWLLPTGTGADEPAAAAAASGDDPAVERLFRHLVPDVTGRRTEAEIVARLRRKWALGQSLRGVLLRLHRQVHELALLKGPAASVVDRLKAEFAGLAPDSVGELLELVSLLDDRGVAHHRVELDLGFGRGLGFYTQMIFEVAVPGPGGLVEVCGGGRYDGLARVLGSERDARGAGFAIGLERVGELLAAQPAPAPGDRP